MKIIKSVIVATLLLAGGAASAADLVVNGGFENPRGAFDNHPALATPLEFGAHTYMTPEFGWQSVACGCLTHIMGPSDDVSGRFDSYPAFPSPAGGNYLLSDADGAFNADGYVYQTLHGLTAGTRYNVGFYQAAGSYYANVPGNQARWQIGFGGTLEGDYRNQLTGAETKLSPVMDLDTSTGAPWSHRRVSFIAHDTTALLSFFATGGPSGQPPFALLDGVSVTAAPLESASFGAGAVPEAATWMMMVAGFGLVGLTRRRRSASVAA